MIQKLTHITKVIKLFHPVNQSSKTLTVKCHISRIITPATGAGINIYYNKRRSQTGFGDK